jgi:predicted RNase H-like HicB family nuclease
MLDACYYSIIERADDGGFAGWIPDLPRATAIGNTEEEVLRGLSRSARLCLHDMVLNGRPLPDPRPLEQLPPSEGRQEQRRLLLIIG